MAHQENPKIRTTRETRGYYGGVDTRRGPTYWLAGAHETRSKARAAAKRWLRMNATLADRLLDDAPIFPPPHAPFKG